MKKENNIQSTVFSPCLQFVFLFSVVVIALSFGASKLFVVTQLNLGKIIFWNIEYFFVLALFMELFGFTKHLTGKKLCYLAVCYGISFGLVWLSPNFQILNFWMLGVLLISLIIPSYMAVTFHIILTISYCMVNNLSVEEFICYFTFGTLILLLVKFMDKLPNIILILIIGVTTNLAFLILLQDFKFVYTTDSTYVLVSTAVMVIFLSIFIYLFDPYKKKETVVKAELMNRLKEYSNNLYDHSMYIGELSEGAAKLIRANESVAKAGGCYHEIGRIQGKNYIEEGLKILEENGVSKEVMRVVAEHNIHGDVPTSKEAEIVMLSDSIASTIQYLKTRQEKESIQVDAVVESIFTRRFEKGLLNESGLSMEDIVELRKYYKEFMKEI